MSAANEARGRNTERRAFNAYAMAQTQFDEAAEFLWLDGAGRELLRQPMREYQFCIPVRMDDGTVRIFRGFRVHSPSPLEVSGTVRSTVSPYSVTKNGPVTPVVRKR